MIGNIINGSIQQQGQELVFEITDGQSILDVSYSGATPQNFMDGIEVVLAGSLIDEDTFEANEILTKCPSKYE
jgi:cytochrome c-type biogenesis protein CcmE